MSAEACLNFSQSDSAALAPDMDGPLDTAKNRTILAIEMPSDFDICRTAILVVNHQSESACFHAAQKAEDLLEVGDRQGAASWRRKLKASETPLSVKGEALLNEQLSPSKKEPRLQIPIETGVCSEFN